MCDALVRHGFGHITIRWIKATVEGRLAATTLNDSFRRVVVPSVPQEDVLSPLLWYLDDLIARLNGVRVYTQGYADDISFGSGEILKHSVIAAHAVGPSHSRLGAVRPVCRLIPIKLNSSYLQGK